MMEIKKRAFFQFKNAITCPHVQYLSLQVINCIPALKVFISCYVLYSTQNVIREMTQHYVHLTTIR